MGYGIRDGDIISQDNPKAGSLTLSQPLYDFRATGGIDPYDLWASQPAVRTVIDFIAQTVSSVSFDVYQGDADGGKVIDTDHPLQAALHQPWPKQGQGRFIQSLILDLFIFGRWGFFAMPLEAGGYEFPKLKGNRFSLTTDGFGRFESVAVWGKKGTGPAEYLPTTDLVFDLGPEPLHGKHRYGTTAVTTLEDLAKELGALSGYREDLFKNSARVPAVIERPQGAGKWSDDAWNRFKTDFSSYKAGGGNAGGTPILEDGMTYKPVDTVSPKDAQYIEVRKLALEEAAEALHVPPELVGARPGTYSNIVALREQLYVDVLGPVIRWTQDSLNVGMSHLLNPGEEIRADIDSKLRTDWATRSKIYQTTVGRPIQTVNEARAREGWPAVEGGDELIIPMNVTEGGLASPTDTGQTNEPDPADPLTETSLGKARAPGAKADDGARDEPDQDPPPVPTDRDEEPLRAAIQGLADELDPAITAIVARLWDRLGLDDVEDEKAAHAKASGAVVGSEALAAAFRAQDAKAIAGILENHLGAVAAESSLQTLGELGADLGVWSAEAQYGWCSKAGETYAQLLVDQQLYGRLLDIEENGVQQVKLRMQAILNKAHIDARSWMTEMATEVVSFGAQDAAKAAHATHKTWHTTSSNPRESHSALNGLTIPVDETFPNGLRWPGDWTGTGPETANCACRVTYSTEE